MNKIILNRNKCFKYIKIFYILTHFILHFVDSFLNAKPLYTILRGILKNEKKVQ